MAVDKSDHPLRLVGRDERRRSPRHDGITQIHEPSTHEENVAFAREMLTYFAQTSRRDPGWVRRMIDVVVDLDGEGSILPLTMLVLLNADVIERNMAAQFPPGLRVV